MLHRFILIKKGIQSTTQKFEVEIRRKYKSLKKNNIQNFNFDKYIRDIFFSINFNFNYYGKNYQQKLNAHKFFQILRKYILLILIKQIYEVYCIFQPKKQNLQKYIFFFFLELVNLI